MSGKNVMQSSMKAMQKVLWHVLLYCLTHTRNLNVHKITNSSRTFSIILFRYYLHKEDSSCRIVKSERVDDGPVLQLFYVLLGLVKRCVLLHRGRRAFNKLHKVMTVHLVHDAEHASAVVADAFQVLAFTRERLGCWEEKINFSAAVFLWLRSSKGYPLSLKCLIHEKCMNKLF